MSLDTVAPRMRVVFAHPENGNETDQSRARRFLVLDEAYVVDRVRESAFETRIWLEGQSEVSFNSVQFEDANQFIAQAKTPRMALAAARPIFREAFKHVPLDLQVKATIALAELDASITAHFPAATTCARAVPAAARAQPADPARPPAKLALVTFPPRDHAATTSNTSTAADDRGPSEPR